MKSNQDENKNWQLFSFGQSYWQSYLMHIILKYSLTWKKDIKESIKKIRKWLN
jgi:hypothetical protein